MVFEVNNAKLVGKIAEKGFTKSSIADEIGISRSGMWKKFQGQYSWTLEDIYGLSKVLELTSDEILAIWFGIDKEA